MAFKYIDIHTHINLDAFKDDFQVVAEHTHAEGVAYINVGTGKETSQRAFDMLSLNTKDHERASHIRGAEERELETYSTYGESLGDDSNKVDEVRSRGIFATVGLHPVRAGGEQDDDGTPPEIFDRSYYEELAKQPGVVAIGECGFDYYRVLKDTKAKQEEAFIAQIELANDLGKPLMLHIRDVKGSMGAYEDALAVLKAHAKVLGNVHFFAGTYEIAKQFWEIGYTTSFTGVITFASQYDEIIQKAPLAMLHAETDAPYVAPVPHRGQRNEPRYVGEVYKRIAELRNEDEDVVREQLLANARRLFRVTL